MKTVLVTPDLLGPTHNGGIGTFVYQFARLLHQHGQSAQILYTGPLSQPRREWQARYRDLSVTVTHVPTPSVAGDPHGNWDFVRRSKAVYEHLPPDTDLVYLQGWRADGFHLARMRRYQASKSPRLVSILHSATRWAQMGSGLLPSDPSVPLALDFAERYTVQHSDAVISPSQYMLDWARDWGWALPAKQFVAPLPFYPPGYSPSTTGPIKQIVFFGRLERRKGLLLLRDALTRLTSDAPDVLAGLERIVLLGKPNPDEMDLSPEDFSADLTQRTGIQTLARTDLDSTAAQAFLAHDAAQTLVVIPSLRDNLPYTVIEALSVPKLALLVAETGGIPEIVNNPALTCAPTINGLAAALARAIASPPRPQQAYDWQAANARWWDLHQQVAQQPLKVVADSPPDPAVTVCVAHYNLGRYLPQTLAALAQQTHEALQVVVVDDASDDPAARAVFDECAATYTARGWRFIQLETNIGPSAARNLAAEQTMTPYLIFLDADNLPTPQIVARFVEAIHNSRADCLTCYLRFFRGDDLPKHLLHRYRPLGADATLGMMQNIFGDTTMIIRREVFEALGGFHFEHEQQRYANYEDYALLTRLVLAGYDLDVLPQDLLYYRDRRASRSNNVPHHISQMRVTEIYRDALRPLGLAQVPPLMLELAHEQRTYYADIQHDPAWAANHIPWRVLLRAFWLKIRKHLPPRS